MNEGIPDGWRSEKFERLCTLQRGFDLPVQNRFQGKYPVIGSNGIVGFHNEGKVQAPGVVTGRSGSIGKVWYFQRAFWALNTSLYVKAFHGNNEKYVYYFLQYFDLSRLGAGTGVPTLNRNDVHRVNIVFPPLPEQRKIASILTSVDEVIDKTEAQISKLQDLKKGMMQELLTKGIGHTEFKQSPVGKIPKKWQWLEVRNVIQGGSQNGLYKPKTAYGKGIEMVHMTEVFGHEEIVSGGMKRVELKLPKENSYLLQQGDLLFARRSLVLEGAGKCSIVGDLTEPASFESSIIRITPDDQILYPPFAFYFISSLQGRIQMMKYARQVAVSGITGSDLMDYVLPIPPLDEQRHISSALKTISNAIIEKQEKLKQITILKKALMQDLLTGKVRVKVN